MNEIDHLMSIVPDLDAALAAIRRLGFASQDPSIHTGRGTSNALIVMPERYWELLSVQEALPSNQFLRDAASHPGLFGLALATDDIEHDVTLLSGRGSKTDPRVDYRRDINIGGTAHTASFSTAGIPIASDLHAYVFFCQHHSPHLVWQDPGTAHPNGAIAIIGLNIVAPDPSHTAKALELLFGTPANPAKHGYSFVAGSLTITIRRPGTLLDASENAMPFLDTLFIRVRHLSETAAFLAATGIAMSKGHDTISVRDAAIGNTVLSFTERDQISA